MFNNDMKPNKNFGDDMSSFTLPSKMNDDLDDVDPLLTHFKPFSDYFNYSP